MPAADLTLPILTTAELRHGRWTPGPMGAKRLTSLGARKRFSHPICRPLRTPSRWRRRITSGGRDCRSGTNFGLAGNVTITRSNQCGCSSMVEPQFSKLMTRVRSPSAALEYRRRTDLRGIRRSLAPLIRSTKRGAQPFPEPIRLLAVDLERSGHPQTLAVHLHSLASLRSQAPNRLNSLLSATQSSPSNRRSRGDGPD